MYCNYQIIVYFIILNFKNIYFLLIYLKIKIKK